MNFSQSGWSWALAACCASIAASATSADVLRVRADASGAGDGSAWADAFTHVDAALAAAVPGDEIWVAQGVYTPPDSVSSFVLKSSVGVYGGFAGTETARSQRNAAANLTVLSGDINQDDTVDTTPFAPPWPNNVLLNTANAGHVVVASGVDASAVIDGFRIEKGAYGPPGTPAGDPLLYGSGIYAIGGSPTIINCDFRGNFAAFGHGGALYLFDSSASVTDCTFDHNLAYQGSGGAIFIAGASAVMISDCGFSANLAVSTYGQTGQGGAIQLNSSLPITIARCVFDGNAARPFGGSSFEIPRGGAISSFCIETDPTTTIRECAFRNNQAAYGGAIFVWNPATVLNCALDHNVAYNFTAQGGQTAGGEGAGIAAQWTIVSVLNSTIVNNSGQESGGISVFEFQPTFPAEAIIRNSIIWGNSAVAEDVSVRNASVNGPFSADDSCIQHLFTADPGEDPIDPDNYPGCIVVDPILVNAAAGDLHLLGGSPCIDTGSNAYVPAGTSTDLEGADRIVRGLVGPGTPIVDMGALEFTMNVPCAADFDGNGSVAVTDIFVFLTAWFAGEPAAYEFSGTPGVPAIFAFLTAWFAGCP